MEDLAEGRYRPWRQKLWALVRGPRVLEVGVGTGKNLPYWPKGARTTAIDLTPGMLAIARRRAQELAIAENFRPGDAQSIGSPDANSDTAVAASVFCSGFYVVLGLREHRRVMRQGGRVLALEHMRPANPVLSALQEALIPVVVCLIGANVNRRTVETVRSAGLQLESVEDLGIGCRFDSYRMPEQPLGQDAA